jgi:hypothetical protein
MALFPTYADVEYSNPRVISSVYNTMVSKMDSGREQRKRKNLFNKWIVQLNYQNITKSDAKILWTFFINRKGRFESFHWIDNFSNTYTSEYFGTGDGETTTFDLPFKDYTAVSIYNNGTPYNIATDETSVGDCYIVRDVASDGGDIVVFDVAPPIGIRLTTSFVGKLKINCRFDEDEISFEEFYNRFAKVGIKLIGLYMDE